MQARLIVGAIVTGLGVAVWLLTNANAESRANLAHEKAKTAALASQVAGVATEYEKRLRSQEESYRVRDAIRKDGDARRREAEDRIGVEDADEVVDWRNVRIPAAVVNVLCSRPGSCSVPGEPAPPGGPDGVDTRNPATRATNH